ncbi:chemotaxis protein CheX [Granulosicoccus antarcticus]|uniref:Chemotaxis phosphatase CheX-like domain-containing protein n=1 Tax=Granulosicoccus antarcticus IMCC3135 TaxID=1192854 RepID=A0A2Z2NNJ1_9GAMM|nr:chemotaxis protein CheX [Granulosicoccus antarcticus]ASJ70400.1 hypothetical protein IMCC3135_01405 [Granulosicoccus antarcticus IMCC3135]
MKTLSEEELADAIDVVCMTVFEMPVSIGLPEQIEGDECMDAGIQISGAWHGRVQVRASVKFLSRAASHIFLKDVSEVDRQDCIDIISEFTNMLGGSIKCMLPESCNLGLPMVCMQDIETSPDVKWHYFNCGKQAIAVAMLEATTGQSAAA